ncbi:MAG: type II toxin-antitoxin system Phd/YefM family antitoxin [Gemmatimonadota bacterium]|nr:type II toxin-antitoxin system Phd/YefM family antitoxin [Gemmatimonadota bacterium]
MARIRLTDDVRPLSELRANLAAFVQRVRKTGRPMVLTQHGRSAAVLVDVEAYEDLLERVELLEDVQKAERQVAQGRGISPAQAKRRVLARLAK